MSGIRIILLLIAFFLKAKINAFDFVSHQRKIENGISSVHHIAKDKIIFSHASKNSILIKKKQRRQRATVAKASKLNRCEISRVQTFHFLFSDHQDIQIFYSLSDSNFQRGPPLS